MINHSVPFFSQHTDFSDPEWSHRACGLASLKMLLDYWQSVSSTYQTTTLPNLLETGLKIGAYIPNTGWSHRGLVNVAIEFGYTGFNEDLSKSDFSLAWEKLTSALEKYPLIASITTPNGGHLIVVTRLDEKNVYINDSAQSDSITGKTSLPLDEFEKVWTKRFLVVHPH